MTTRIVLDGEHTPQEVLERLLRIAVNLNRGFATFDRPLLSTDLDFIEGLLAVFLQEHAAELEAAATNLPEEDVNDIYDRLREIFARVKPEVDA